MMNTVTVVLIVLTFAALDISCSNSITVRGSTVNATRVCKPGPNIKTTSNKGKCLVIGDSVSIGYTYHVETSLKEICDVYHAPWDTTDGGALDTKYAVQCLQLFLRTNLLEEVNYDVILFNFGLHDADFDFQSPEEYTDPKTYKENLQKIKKALLATGSHVGYILTTPVPFNTTSNERVKDFNIIARDVMSSPPEVPIADLYHWVTLVCGEPPYSYCEIADRHQPSPHYTYDGYGYLAVVVSGLFSKLLLPGQHVKGKQHAVVKDNKVVEHILHNSRLPCTNDQGQIVNMCPTSMTCSPSKYSNTRWGCCPLPNAVSCDDGKHCCPAGFECDTTCHLEQCVCHKK